MGKKALYNKVNKVELKESLAAEPFDRITASFYRYVKIDEPELFRDDLYQKWDMLNIFGRVYVSKEGINSCLLYTSPSPRDRTRSRMPSSA